MSVHRKKDRTGKSPALRPAPERAIRDGALIMEAVDEAVKKASSNLLQRQAPEGYWVFDLEADTTIPSEYIILKRFLGHGVDEALRERLTGYILRRQLPDGGWPLYEGGFSDLSATVKAYFALKLSGLSPNDPHMVSARRLILSLGGAARVNVFTRITLALFGQIPWRTVPAMPVQIMLLPRWFFFHLSKVSYWSRTVIAPLLVLYAKRPVCKLGPDETLAELFVEPPERLRNIDRFVPGRYRKNLFLVLDRLLKRMEPLLTRILFKKSVLQAEKFTVERMKGEGGLGAIFPAMANAVMALRVLGYSDDHPDMARGLRAIDDLLVDGDGEAFCQPCLSPVWDTCLTLSALKEAGVEDEEAIKKAVRWLFEKQVLVPGDWSENAPGVEPGGWAFQFENNFYPDVDDTAMVLMALLRAGAMESDEYRERMERAVNWLLGMQSSDGGWGAFDIDNNRLYLNDIPFADHGALLDPSTSDVTGRCVELLSMLGLRKGFLPVERAIEFLDKEQEEWGAWFGRWGVNYIYGTWSVLMGLRQAGEDMASPRVKRAMRWLRSCQNSDGGWGETCFTYNDPGQAGQGRSTPSQTAWALLGLMAAGLVDDPSVERGVRFLLKNQKADGDWDETLYTGTGFPKVFYLRYHGYRLYFPLWALSVYRRLKRGRRTRQDEVGFDSPAPLRLKSVKG